MRDGPFETMEEIAAYLGGDTIECLECGKHFRLIASKHLRMIHGMTQDEYRERWGIPKTLGLACAPLRQQQSSQTQRRIADGSLTFDHLPTASNPKTRRPMTPKTQASRRAHSELVRQLRPGDHSKLPPGARRSTGRRNDRAREYQQAYRALLAGDEGPMRHYINVYSATFGEGNYSPAEEATILAMYPHYSVKQIALALDRPLDGLKAKIVSLLKDGSGNDDE